MEMDNWFESESVGGGYEREQEADNPKQTNGNSDEQRSYGDDNGGDEENNNGGIIVIGAENNHKSMPCSNRIRSGSSSTRRGESESKFGSSRRRNYRKRSRGCGDDDESDDFGFEDAKRLAEEKLIECVDGDGDVLARKLLALQNKEEIVAQPQAAAHVVASAASPPPPPPPLDYFRLDMSASEWFRQLDNCTRIREAEEALKKDLFTEPLDISDDSNCRGRPKGLICFCDDCQELRRGFYTYYNSSQRRSPDCDEVFEAIMSRDTRPRIVASNPEAAHVAALSAAIDADDRLSAHWLRYLELIRNREGIGKDCEIASEDFLNLFPHNSAATEYLCLEEGAEEFFLKPLRQSDVIKLQCRLKEFGNPSDEGEDDLYKDI